MTVEVCFDFLEGQDTSFGADRFAHSMGNEGSARGVNLPGREAYHSPASSAEVKNAWEHPSTSPHAFSAHTWTG
jgi:hypothetical protein